MKSACLKRFFLPGTLFLALIFAPQSSANSFDASFRYADARFLAWHSGGDFYWLKAQCKAESNLNPSAVSSALAKGLCQFMDATWRECMAAFNTQASPFSAKASILCAGWYMRRMLLGWSSPRSTMDRWRWAWASYNWGFGNVLNAQRRIYGQTEYDYLKNHLPRETRDYVARIERFRESYP